MTIPKGKYTIAVIAVVTALASTLNIGQAQAYSHWLDFCGASGTINKSEYRNDIKKGRTKAAVQRRIDAKGCFASSGYTKDGLYYKKYNYKPTKAWNNDFPDAAWYITIKYTREIRWKDGSPTWKWITKSKKVHYYGD